MNEEMKKILDTHYGLWLNRVKDEPYPPLIWRFVVCFILYPIRMLFRLLWSTVIVGLLFIVTRMFMYTWIFIVNGAWREIIHADLKCYEVMCKRAWLVNASIIGEWIVRFKTMLRPFTFKSWLINTAGWSYTDKVKEMHEALIVTLTDIQQFKTNDGKIGLCLDECNDLIKDMLSNIIKPKLRMINGEVWIGK